jgi:hypothetical protein
VIYCLYVWVPVISGSIIGNLLTKWMPKYLFHWN